VADRPPNEPDEMSRNLGVSFEEEKLLLLDEKSGFVI